MFVLILQLRWHCWAVKVLLIVLRGSPCPARLLKTPLCPRPASPSSLPQAPLQRLRSRWRRCRARQRTRHSPLLPALSASRRQPCRATPPQTYGCARVSAPALLRRPAGRCCCCCCRRWPPLLLLLLPPPAAAAVAAGALAPGPPRTPRPPPARAPLAHPATTQPAATCAPHPAQWQTRCAQR